MLLVIADGPTRFRAALSAAGVLISLNFCGCASESETGYDLVEAYDADFARIEAVSDVSPPEILQLVQEQPAPDGNGTVADWIERQARSARGQPLFPRWQVQRRGINRFEVRYTFTWIGLDNQIESRGYIWHVDSALNKVQGPKTIVIGESSRARSFAEQQQRRAEDPEYSLR
jgi:hypothetical protein